MNKVKPISAKERRFDFDKYGMSIAPDFNAKDFFGFKPASQHFKQKNRGLNR